MDALDLFDDAPGVDRPTWRGRLHLWAFVVALPVGAFLIASTHHPSATVAAVVYVAALLGVYGTSAAYHRLAHSERARRVMRLLDHSMIFVLIAATYTPLCLLAMPTAWGIPTLVVVWLVAAAGVLVKVVAFDRLTWLGYALYPILGCLVLFILPVVAAHTSVMLPVLVFAGGLTYGLGALILKAKRPNPWPKTFGYHEFWHVCTVVAGSLHLAALGLLIR
ncbi:MAG TPA: hemolysin III family protein [Ilumatobacteraceae bacterium]